MGILWVDSRVFKSDLDSPSIIFDVYASDFGGFGLSPS